MTNSITLRPITPDDEAFLCRVYANTRTEELAVTGWDDAKKEAFLRMQFEAQHRYYQESFPNASYQVILYGERPIGRLYVDRREQEIKLIDIALLPEHRNRGWGRILMKEVLAEGAAVGKPVRIHVEKFNPALRFYERIGFRPIGDTGVYLLMEWTSQSAICEKFADNS